MAQTDFLKQIEMTRMKARRVSGTVITRMTGDALQTEATLHT